MEGKMQNLKKINIAQEALIRDRITRLPHPERLAIYMHFWEKANYVEIANSVGIKREDVVSLIHRGLARLHVGLRSVELRLDAINKSRLNLKNGSVF